MKNSLISRNLKFLREKANMTQEQVADRLGLGRDSIIRIEKGLRKVEVEELEKFASLYDVSRDIIIYGNLEGKSDMKGIILAGGTGTRLYPITEGISKQLLPIYDKPMIYYPLSVLMQVGIKDILIITTNEDQDAFRRLLGDGSNFGINLEYIIQPSPDGLAQAFILGEEFIGNSSCAMILGDNIFYGNGLDKKLQIAYNNAINGTATIFGYQVKDPERFGVMELDEKNNVIGVEEKPENPKSDYAITGLYFYPKGVSKKAKMVKPSKRGELEITTLNDLYLQDGNLKAALLGEGYTWFDTGTFSSLLEASNMIRTIEESRDRVICSPEIIGYKKGWLSKEKMQERAALLSKNTYGQSLKRIVEKDYTKWKE
jgi:glucose-1-phosphate thymidylyltransferase